MTPENISALLLKSRTWNQANAITGCLLYYDDEFIQLIEGDEKTVQDLNQRIIKDPRHTDIIFLGENPRTKAFWHMAQQLLQKWPMSGHYLAQARLTLPNFSGEEAGRMFTSWVTFAAQRYPDKKSPAMIAEDYLSARPLSSAPKPECRR